MGTLFTPKIKDVAPPAQADTLKVQEEKNLKANKVRAQVLRDLNANSQAYKAPTGLRL